MRHLNDDPLPVGIYDAPQAAIIRYAQKSTRLERIDDKTYGDLAAHFSTQPFKSRRASSTLRRSYIQRSSCKQSSSALRGR